MAEQGKCMLNFFFKSMPYKPDLVPWVCFFKDLRSLVRESIAFYSKQKVSKLMIEKEEGFRNGE